MKRSHLQKLVAWHACPAALYLLVQFCWTAGSMNLQYREHVSTTEVGVRLFRSSLLLRYMNELQHLLQPTESYAEGHRYCTIPQNPFDS